MTEDLMAALEASLEPVRQRRLRKELRNQLYLAIDTVPTFADKEQKLAMLDAILNSFDVTLKDS